ncbi:unnamed protein product [Medioppia subpectinata]|uniref:Cathepsin L n=1 Tax=Medioppia subpectinata TaxID=1979941 RepID=A0A7R9KX79_9ACAR|nr:unnamed protein product [Medioppia subpectinata]CAG2111488.1 unnamed protein product [Medioppia subpectinata]
MLSDKTLQFRNNSRFGVNSVEENKRRQIFEANYRLIVKHNSEANAGQHSYRLGVNQFADMTADEYKQMVNGFRAHSRPPVRSVNTRTIRSVMADNLPASVDWRDKGIVAPVKNQGNCGSCWAFAAIASLEGQLARKTGKLVTLSEENLVDCSATQGNNGCNGGLMDYAYEYIIAQGGVDSEASYGYKHLYDGQTVYPCAYNAANRAATVKNYTNIPMGDEAALREAVATIGPIAVAIDAQYQTFQMYESGVYDEPLCFEKMEDLDHGVTVVGYGSDNGRDYWLVRNSWATTWGDKGYIKMSRNRHNQCGIASAATYPTGVDNNPIVG